MSRKNSLAAKAARREQNAASKQVNNCNNSKPMNMEIPEQVKNPTSQTVGIVVDLVYKSGDSVPVLFQTDRSEFLEVVESVNKIKDVEEQQKLWLAKMTFALSGIIPIDETFFRSVLFSIAASGDCIRSFEENPNSPVAFGVMIYEGSIGYNVLNMTYETWVDIFKMYKSQQNFKQNLLQ